MASILIVDDDIEYAETVARLLKQAGHTVTTADDTAGLVERVVTEKPALLILDVMFPDNPVAGFDAARAVRHRREIRATPIILLTSVNQEFPMDFSAKDIDKNWMPVQDFIEKPVAKADLLARVNRLLAPSA